MSDEKDLQQLKREAAERAKQLAKERLAAKQAAEQTEPSLESEDDVALAKKKAAAAAKAKAAALAKQKAAETGDLSEEELAKKKAAAAAKAKAAALAKQKAAESGELSEEELAKKKAAAAAKAKAVALAKQKVAETGDLSEEELAKKKAAAAAKAKAAAAAKAKNADVAEQKEETPSPNQPYLDKYVKVIEQHLGKDVLENAYINRLSKDVPTLVVKKDTYFKVAEFLKYNEQLSFDYLSELHGTDFQTHMEVYVHLYSYKNRQSVALKVKIDRDNPVIDSLVPLWPGANWPECEAYDLLGIRFEGHPNLIRIFLGENWVGYPLRKDYEPYDMEG
ncbi:NADH-quinone oxidoreductase subunit C [Anoxybacillus flavithermus]|uniref:NADH-quinone oxidoreductase subunit C n=1 Tax=Anoxybacillus flavithermus TaxID=33934 RepID=UPI00186944D4|nr:NADH-quinone oxidoreductase subunit C [Anoxybacillus flavithermus]MBE2940567.1 NADH-quinone oxidoreductase subunit C [Anoxybacillus flavithermus]MBE2943297.1 NADH-quinone oxidoreductase subunit C [Anoxybacillus flavithermus]MBE2951618.1 NADH-quinone oxidoreductase subunit C [Anoxybacillus flavithermus]MBE2954186.1 NADH-quinone oxidoreductase subunit C [Anoxybacillus flavithermus]MBE2959633.1 NADH-quinone oxidoreductase subunit C [Anoxybacillus flavithermus]